MVLLLVLAVGCSADDGTEPSSGTTGPSEELRVEGISSGAPGQGPARPRVVLAPSAAALSQEIGAAVPDSGGGTYLAAYWGEKPTGGYSLSVRSARLEGERVSVQLSLKEPPPDAIVTQALTYPFTVAVVHGPDLRGKGFSFVDHAGRELGWPDRRVGG
jgi:hypothetical protein